MKRYNLAEFKGWKRAVRLKYNTKSKKELLKIVTGQSQGDRKAAISVLLNRKQTVDGLKGVLKNHSQRYQKTITKDALSSSGDSAREYAVGIRRDSERFWRDEKSKPFSEKYISKTTRLVGVPDTDNYTDVRKTLTFDQASRLPYDNRLIPQSKTGYLGYLSPNASPEAYEKSIYKGFMEEDVPINNEKLVNRYYLNMDGHERLQKIRKKRNK